MRRSLAWFFVLSVCLPGCSWMKIGTGNPNAANRALIDELREARGQIKRDDVIQRIASQPVNRHFVQPAPGKNWQVLTYKYERFFPLFSWLLGGAGQETWVLELSFDADQAVNPDLLDVAWFQPADADIPDPEDGDSD